MRTPGSILWLIFGGLFMAISYAIAGIVVFVFIITIPFGIQSFTLAGAALVPFDRTVMSAEDAQRMNYRVVIGVQPLG